jgi:pyruvate/2-oxoglutarate/acetoin dehydrogenase E1 component/TPP-dependent pyruvate/acetoin dehydrogenase alpha subunit
MPTKNSPTLAQIKSGARESILQDYRLVFESRQASLTGRKEVFSGKAKFGIFGDGKELAQVAMAKVFRKGDFRSGYYRDQTFMMAIGALTLEEYFAQLYAHADVLADPASAGRSMNGHFGTRLLDNEGKWLPQTDRKNSSADVSPTGSQMPRLLGLAWASTLYRNNPSLQAFEQFSVQGNEVAFGTIGNASTSEGMFFEAINAAGVLQVPMLMSVWDDEYGISVSKEHHTIKGSIGKALEGFRRSENDKGIELFTVKGWDYQALLLTYKRASELCRKEHIPVLVHVVEMTQPQGHSTSGSHERYKSKERLVWEQEFDCIPKFRHWIEASGIATVEELEQIEQEARDRVKQARSEAWNAFVQSMKEDFQEASRLLEKLATIESAAQEEVKVIEERHKKTLNPLRLDSIKAIKQALWCLSKTEHIFKSEAVQWLHRIEQENANRYSSHLHSASEDAATNISSEAPHYREDSPLVDGREVLQACFDAAFSRDPRVVAFGEDVGKIGDVNQAFAGLQEKYGEVRISDTSIRECTILGQGIGAALRGLRPIAEIQYLDYLAYAIQIMSDDLACLQYRTKGGQKAPVIIRTRGHRLEGIWHSGSPIGMILHAIRGIHVLVPRDMTQAAGFYNTLLASDEPGLVIECLNGYRLKEKMPENIGTLKTPLGIPEMLRAGRDVTVVTYGSMCRIVLDAAEMLDQLGISCEVIDVQSLLPFDLHHNIVESVKKTSRVVFADEDVPGGASAYMMQQVLEVQQAYRYLDSQPITISAQAHRPAYGSDGDYFSKPNTETVVEKIYALMQEASPALFPPLY